MSMGVPDHVRRKVERKLADVDHAKDTAAAKEHWRLEELYKKKPYLRPAPSKVAGNGNITRIKK